MPTIYDLVTAQNAKDFIENSTTPTYLGAALFPNKKQLGLNLSYIKGRGGAAVVLKAASFDAAAPVRDRIGITKLETEMPFFRERMNVKEVERQQINTFLAGGLTQQAEAIVRLVYDDQKTLVDGANATAERMRMQLISEGKISLAAEGVAHDYDYELDQKQFDELTGTDTWDQATSTPVQDILEWIKAAQKFSKTRPGRMVLNSTTFGYLAAHDSIKKDLNPLGAANIILTDEDVKAYLERKLKLKIAIYDEIFTDEEGVTKTFYPDDKITLLPASTLGNTVYGTTPEESDLMTGTDADVQVVNTGVAVTTNKIVHPVNVETIVSEIVLPSFEQADKIFIAKVK